ncbi:MAG: DUF7322 domain-containing protein [Halovenus sp.]
MSDRFDTDPDDVLEPDDEAGRQGETQFDTEPDRPAVEIPEAPKPPNMAETEADLDDFGDVDPQLQRLFWKLVFAIKFALLALTLGALFLVFGENPTIGGQLLAFGLILSVYAVYRYRDGKARIEAGEFDTDDESAETAGEQS